MVPRVSTFPSLAFSLEGPQRWPLPFNLLPSVVERHGLRTQEINSPMVSPSSVAHEGLLHHGAQSLLWCFDEGHPFIIILNALEGCSVTPWASILL